VDGGVDVNTHTICKESGADVLVAGSAYFKAENRAEFVKLIQQ
jgi:ribulose-phosphate 3-epimerase